MTKRLLPSNPQYRAFNELWTLYAIAKNPQIWTNTTYSENNYCEYDVDEYQRQEILERPEYQMELLLNMQDNIICN